MAQIRFNTLQPCPSRLKAVLGVLAAILVVALFAAHFMESNGHKVTGMTNSVVWGLPHVFAIFLIVAASGALNIASIASVFGKTEYKPLAPLSGLLAIALLAGGLSVLVLDLGRPDRLIVAMLHQNLRSIFAWNVFLYSGFFVVVGVYVATLITRRLNHFSKYAGLVAFLWRLILTTGTGSIFGFLVARDAFHSALMAPLFIAMSFATGLAVFMLVLQSGVGLGGPAPGPALTERLGRLLGVFIAAQLYFVAVLHVTNLYAANGRDLEAFLLISGGIYPALFWLGQIVLGGVLPLCLLFLSSGKQLLSAALVIIGGLMAVYALLIGGQAYPMSILPGYVLQSSFGDGQIAAYVPTLPELLLGLGGVALTLIIVLLGTLVLRFMPDQNLLSQETRS